MAWLNENMIMRNRTHGGYKVLVNELWEFCDRIQRRHGHDVGAYVLQGAGRHARPVRGAGQRARHPSRVGVPRSVRPPRHFTRQGIRNQINDYMRTVMREEPLDPTLEVLPDEESW
jgi:hypothetical protein